MNAVVTQWGNSLGLRIPKQFADFLAVHAGDRVSVCLQDNSIIIKPIRIQLSSLLANITSDNLPDCAEFEIYGVVGGELW
jgi:antitoxin MazE